MLSRVDSVEHVEMIVVVQVDLSDKVVAKIDGRIVCSFVRPVSASLTYIQENRAENYTGVTNLLKTFDLANHFYIQMAWGEVYKGEL